MNIETISKAALHDIEAPFKWAAKAEHVLSVAIKEQPELKDALSTLIKKCDGIGAEVMIDVAERGLNIVDDIATAKAIGDLGVYLKDVFVPLVRKVYGELEVATKD